MRRLFIAFLLLGGLLLFAALFDGVGALPVVLIALLAAVAIVFLWRSMVVRRPPDTRV